MIQLYGGCRTGIKTPDWSAERCRIIMGANISWAEAGTCTNWWESKPNQHFSPSFIRAIKGFINNNWLQQTNLNLTTRAKRSGQRVHTISGGGNLELEVKMHLIFCKHILICAHGAGTTDRYAHCNVYFFSYRYVNWIVAALGVIWLSSHRNDCRACAASEMKTVIDSKCHPPLWKPFIRDRHWL